MTGCRNLTRETNEKRWDTREKKEEETYPRWKRIVNLTTQCIRIGYHPRTWKVTKRVVIRKPNKPNYSNPKAYRIICLLNCLGKIVEKVVTSLIAETIDTK